MFALLATGIQFLPKSYQGIASVEVLAKTATLVNPDIVSADSIFTDETAGTELGIFNSPELRTAVIRKLNLLNDPEFNPNLTPSLLHNILGYFHQSVPVKLDENRILFDTVGKLYEKVVVQPVSHSKIIQVIASSHDPVKAAAIANAVVAEYIAAHQQQKEDAYRQAYNFTNLRLPALRADMIAKSELVNQFRQQHQMVSGQYAAIRREKLTEASKQLIDAQNRLEQLRSQVAQSHIGDILHNPAVLNSLTIQRLREQEAQIVAEGAGHGMQSANYQLRQAAVDGVIRAEAERIILSLPEQLAEQESLVANQQKEVNHEQEEVSKMDALQSQIDPLENDMRIATKQYTDFLSSDAVSRPDVAFTAVNVRILSSAATQYKANFPNNKIMLPASFVLSFLSTAALALYRGRRVGFVTAEQFKSAFNIEPIARIPMRVKGDEHSYWEAIMFLSMKLAVPYEKKKIIILLTSAQPQEGKTTTACGLAEAFAVRNMSVVLVDADLRSKTTPGKSRMIGLGEILSGAARVEDAIIHKHGISILRAGSTGQAGNSTTLLASNAMPALLRTLHETHDIIVIDGPSASITGDSWVLAKLVDRVVCVVKQSDTDQESIQNAFRNLDRKSNEIDIVLNMNKVVKTLSLPVTQQAGPNSAVTYFREYAGPILAGLIGIEVGRVWGFRTIGLCILYSSVLALLLNLVEYLDPIDYYTAVNEVNFFRLKLTGDTSGFAATSVYTPDDIVTFSTTVLFNITGASPQDFAPLVTYRFLGTIVNPISNGYVMAVLGILAVSLKRGYWLWLIIPMLVLVGVKGANILLFSSLILYGIWLFTKNLKIVLIASICWTILYIAMGIIIGLSHNDFHVLGFLGGVKSIVHNPLGHGIGVGGNGSAEAHKGFKWTGTGGFANNGVDFALESSIGVLIYQMGVFSVIVMTVFGVFLWRAPWGSDQSHTNPTSRDIIFLSLGMIIVNGIFQEEAFAPYACGLIMLLVGVLTGNRYRGSRTLLANPV
ncbi:unnamed protein product [Sphagnum tenellum]